MKSALQTARPSGPMAGRVVMITGAASGLGRAYAEHLAASGADMVLFDLGDGHRDAEPGYPLATRADLEETHRLVTDHGRRSIMAEGDVRDSASLQAAADQGIELFGRIDVLIANAGVVAKGKSWTMSDQMWDLILDTNLGGAWKSCKAVIPHMIERHFGRIILTASASIFNTSKDQAAYIAAKGGIHHLTRALAAELGEFGITVNAVAASTVPSGANRGLAMLAGVEHEKYLGRLSRSRQLIPDMLTAREVAAVVAFLASPESAMITGVTFPIDGGVSAS